MLALRLTIVLLLSFNVLGFPWQDGVCSSDKDCFIPIHLRPGPLQGVEQICFKTPKGNICVIDPKHEPIRKRAIK